MRLIDADRLKTVMSETVMVIVRNPKMDNKEAYVTAAFDAFEKMIQNALIIDAVPVVCCRDCKHYRYPYCEKHFDAYIRTGDWFCADGERR